MATREELLKSADDVKRSWFEMTDDALNGMFLSRAASINEGVMTADEANEFITETSKMYMEMYDNMSRDEIKKKMLEEMLEHLLKRLAGGDA